MAVYVDQLLTWPTKIRCFKKGSCHMFADTEIELHALAKRIGLKRAWFQDKGLFHHYDLTPSVRAKALIAGAIELGRNEAVLKMREIKGRISNVGNPQQTKNAVDDSRRSHSWR